MENYDSEDFSQESESEEGMDPMEDTTVWKTSLCACLDTIQSSGDFAVFNRHAKFVNPGLTIEGGRVVPLPLPLGDTEAIKALCRQAPFGKGDQTVVDTTVRNTWELDKTQFRFANPAWQPFFDTVLRQAADGLGLLTVTARPHKLLLYEEGSFFKRHKDSEKEPGMVGTLVICLPSEHEGGEVHLSFNSGKKTFATAEASTWDMTTLAWYSDVTHEIAELRKGYRLVLTYNLTQTGPTKSSAGFFVQQADNLRTTLGQWQTRAPDLHVLYYYMDHQYSQSSLSLGNMKGRDRAVCRALESACAENCMYLLLAHWNRTETGNEYDYRYEEVDEDEREVYHSLGTVYSCDGKAVGSDYSVDEDELLG